MAAGLTSALARVGEIIEGCDAAAGWRKSKQRITSLEDDNVSSAGVDHKYWLDSSPRRSVGAIAGSHHDRQYVAAVELARYWGGGDSASRDFLGLLKSLEAEADIVEQSITERPQNWAFATTGIAVINLVRSARVIGRAPSILIWKIELNLYIRQPDVAAAVA